MLNLRPVTLAEIRSVLNTQEETPLIKRLMKTHNFNLKEHEYRDLERLICELEKHELHQWESSFYFSTKPAAPINDEFDMFYSDDQYILNLDFKDNTSEVEQKSHSELKEDILIKFRRQNRLLDTIKNGRQVDHLAVCVEDDNTYYWSFSPEENKLVEFKIEEIVQIFNNLNVGNQNNELGELDASNFILSPVNNTEDFLSKKYWLTEDQNKIVDKIADLSSGQRVFAVKGAGGTGKTMIAFDLIMKFTELRKLYCFTGTKQEGHKLLETRIPKLKIVSAKEFADIKLEDYDVILVDEAQRAYKNVRKKIDQSIKNAEDGNLKKVVVFYHIEQTLSKKDFGQGIQSLLSNRSEQVELVENVRSNENIHAFIEKLFDLSYSYESGVTNETIANDVEVRYFTEFKEAKKWLSLRCEQGYIILENVPEYGESKQYQMARLSTDVIGQDLEKVGVVIDDSFYYDFIEEEKKLVLKNKKTNQKHYLPIEGLYVNLSRAKSKLAVAIVNNPDILEAMADYVFGRK